MFIKTFVFVQFLFMIVFCEIITIGPEQKVSTDQKVLAKTLAFYSPGPGDIVKLKRGRYDKNTLAHYLLQNSRGGSPGKPVRFLSEDPNAPATIWEPVRISGSHIRIENFLMKSLAVTADPQNHNAGGCAENLKPSWSTDGGTGGYYAYGDSTNP